MTTAPHRSPRLPLRLAALGLLALPLAAPLARTAHAQTDKPAAAPAVPSPAAGAPTGTDHDARLEAHIKALHDKLGITSAEESAWGNVATVMRENAVAIRTGLHQRRTGLATMTALDNMRSYADLTAARAQEAQKMLAAFQPLYDQFGAAQKAKADEVFRAETERSLRRGHHHNQSETAAPEQKQQ